MTLSTLAFLPFLFLACEGRSILSCDHKDGITCNGVVLEYLHGIRVINLSGRGVEELVPGSLDVINNFTRVDLSNNSIEEIKNGVFTGLSLVTVDLSFNQIGLVEAAAFDDMAELRYLRLDHNRISRWNPEWFKGNRNLHQISFRNNLLEELPRRAFQNIRWIHEYDLFVRVVTEVDLSGNLIERVGEEVFGEEEEVGRVNFSNNSLTSVPEGIFERVRYVEEVDFSNNSLGCDSVFYLLNLGSVGSVNMKFQSVNK